MTLLLALLMCAAVKTHEAVPPDFELTRFLNCVEQKEQYGEGNRYGITEATWKQHMKDRPYSDAQDDFWCRLCAVKHTNYLANALAHEGLPPSVYCVASAYHHGLAGFLALAAAGKTSSYGTEIANLYREP
jgi:hypothetical protein